MAANLGAPGLLDRVQMLCGQAASRLPARQAEAVRQAGAALNDPLRLAFVGRVSSGKSTLLNAYLGKRLAPTDEGECTTLVTSVRFGRLSALGPSCWMAPSCRLSSRVTAACRPG